MSVDLNEQYDKIFRYCYFKVRNRTIAEDITQETFLRFLERSGGKNDIVKETHYLYAIAGNLCADEFRKKQAEELTDNLPDGSDYEGDILTNVALSGAIAKLPEDDRELVMLRFVNDVPIGVLSELYGVSRFAMSRRLRKITAFLKKEFNGEEDIRDEKNVKESRAGIV